MYNRHFTTFSLWVVVLVVLATSPGSAGLSAANPPAQPAALGKLAPWVIEHTAHGAQAEFLVVLADQADLSAAEWLPTKLEKGRYVRDALWAKAQSTQAPILAWLKARGVEHRSYYIVNLIWVKGDLALALALAARPDVARIEGNPRISNLQSPIFNLQSQISNLESPNAVEPNITYVRAPEVWAMGDNGQGVVVGGQDTGYDWDHPALVNHYRGWDGSAASHDYNWHDSIHSGGGSCGANSLVPCDDYGHGTHTMGTAVGDDGGSNQIGMAPGAKWIGCRNMNQGVGTPATYLECFEFFLAPYPVGGTPAQGDPSKAPDVTNNSWGCPPDEGCSPIELLTAVQNQRAAGILTVVSAGNDGPGCSSVTDPPSIYAEVYSVGALDTGSDTIANFSSRGPVTVDGSYRRKPDISAPGTNIRSSVPGGGYQSIGWSGTSMAGPHVAGAVALLWSARPSLKNQITVTEQFLSDSAVHIASTECGSSGWPNNTYGYGRLDVKAAVDLASMGALTGVVSDVATAAPITGAKVQVSSPSQNASTTSGAGGVYSLSVLSDTYSVAVSAPGYMTYTTTGVSVASNQTTTLDISLEVTPTFTITGYVRDAFTGQPLSATVGVASVGAPPAQTNPATGFYSLTLAAPPGTVTLQAQAVRYVAQAQVVAAPGDGWQDFDLEPVCLLVVDDDGGMGYESYYTSALDRLGYSYNVVAIAPGLQDLAYYQGVIWETGYQSAGTLTAADQAALADYLDGGGRLFLSGQDIGFDIGNSTFYARYLRAAFHSDDTNTYTLTGLGFLAGLDVTIQGAGGANNQLAPSDMTPVNGGVGVFRYADPYLYGGIAYSNTHRTVYFSFGYEAINTQSQRDDVMAAVLGRLGVCGAPQAPQADFLSGSPGQVGDVMVFTNTTRGTAWMTYTWDLGDGSSLSNVVHPSHVYAQPGQYTVVLTAVNRYGWDTRQETVTVGGPSPSITVNPATLTATLRAGETFSRLLTIGNTGSAELIWSLSEQPPVDWLTLEPISGTLPPAANSPALASFDAAGLPADIYTTTLRIASNDFANPSLDVPVTLTVTCGPVGKVDFSHSPAHPLVGQRVTFTSTVTPKFGDLPTEYLWSFGDGEVGAGPVVTHTFPVLALAHGYTVTLDVFNICLSKGTATRLVVVQPYTVYLPIVIRAN